MEFEWDPKKSAVNKQKHGIDFIEAQKIWKADVRVEAQAFTVEREVRRATIAFIGEKLWVAIWAPRNGPGNRKVRFISVHRAEGSKYEKRYKEKA